MCISTALKLDRDQDTLMINGLFQWSGDMSYRIWLS